jgi:uncharacterized protein
MASQNFAIAIAICCAFVVGLAVNRGSTCAVAAARDLVIVRRADAMVGFMISIGAAGLLTIVAKWLYGPLVHLVGDPPVGVALLSGAVLLGIGATINGACLFGTLGRIGNGELRFAGMPFGLAIGFAIASRIPHFAPGEAVANPLTQPSAYGAAVLLIFALIAGAAWHWLRNRSVTGSRWWSYRGAMLLLGCAGAIEFMLIPGSTYVDAVKLSVLGGMAGYTVPLTATVAALAGTTIAGVTAGTFRVRWPRPSQFGRSLIGGVLMALGGWLIPGGNDALLLAYLPAATVGGLVAYVVMTLTVLGLIWVRRHR